jgi:hypothetical protein
MPFRTDVDDWRFDYQIVRYGSSVIKEDIGDGEANKVWGVVG